jgi:hypothetical protein
MKASYLYVLGISLALVAAAATAQQYKWKDSRGRWVYGDVPPAGAKVIPLKSSTPSNPAAAAKPAESEAGSKAGAKSSKPLTEAEKELEFRRRIKEAQEKAAKTAKEEQSERETKQNCEMAREQVRILASGERVQRMDPKGERYFINDAQRASELEQARRSESEWCK